MVKFSSEFHLFNYSKKVFNTSKKPLTEQQEAELLTKCEEIYELHRILSQKELPIANAHLCDIPKAFAFRIGFELQNGTWNNEVFGWMERFSALARKLKESIDENENVDGFYLDSLEVEGLIYIDKPRYSYKRDYSEEFYSDYNDGVGKKFGLYFIFDDKEELVYVGKSINLFQRLSNSLIERSGEFYAYAEPASKADMHVYELYYINKFKPKLNTGDLSDDELTIVLPELTLSEIKPAFKPTFQPSVMGG